MRSWAKIDRTFIRIQLVIFWINNRSWKLYKYHGGNISFSWFYVIERAIIDAVHKNMWIFDARALWRRFQTIFFKKLYTCWISKLQVRGSADSVAHSVEKRKKPGWVFGPKSTKTWEIRLRTYFYWRQKIHRSKKSQIGPIWQTVEFENHLKIETTFEFRNIWIGIFFFVNKNNFSIRVFKFWVILARKLHFFCLFFLRFFHTVWRGSVDTYTVDCLVSLQMPDFIFFICLK